MSVEVINGSESEGYVYNEDNRKEHGMLEGRTYTPVNPNQVHNSHGPIKGPYPYFPPSNNSEKDTVVTFIMLFTTGFIGGHDFYAGRYGRTAAKIIAWPIGLVFAGAAAATSSPALFIPAIVSCAYPVLTAPLDFLRLLTGNYQDGEGKYIK